MDIKKLEIDLIPSCNICPTCNTECYCKTEIINKESDESDYAFSSDNDINNWNIKESRNVMNSTLNKLELTSFKAYAVSGHMKVARGKQKLAQVNNEVSKRLGAVLNVQQSELQSTEYWIEIDSYQDMNQKKKKDLHNVVELMKEKLEVPNKKEKYKF